MDDNTKKQFEYQSSRLDGIISELNNLWENLRLIDSTPRCPICGDLIFSRAYLGEEDVKRCDEFHGTTYWKPPKNEIWYLICNRCAEHIECREGLMKKTFANLQKLNHE